MLYDDTHNTPTVFYCFLHQIELSHQYFWDCLFSVFLFVATLFSPHFLRSTKYSIVIAFQKINPFLKIFLYKASSFWKYPIISAPYQKQGVSNPDIPSIPYRLWNFCGTLLHHASSFLKKFRQGSLPAIQPTLFIIIMIFT